MYSLFSFCILAKKVGLQSDHENTSWPYDIWYSNLYTRQSPLCPSPAIMSLTITVYYVCYLIYIPFHNVCCLYGLLVQQLVRVDGIFIMVFLCYSHNGVIAPDSTQDLQHFNHSRPGVWILRRLLFADGMNFLN